MNRIVAFILIIIYVTFTTGLLVNVHYCMGKVASVKIENTTSQDNCNACGKKAMSCCNDRLTVLKVSDTHNAVENDANIHAPILVLASFLHTNFIFSLQNAVAGSISTTHSPPLKDCPDIYLHNCNFRI